jgi:uncharacterized protein
MPIVSDTSPLILLAKIGRLDLLRQLFAEVFIPPEVSREVEAGNRVRPEAALIRNAPWIQVDAREQVDAGQVRILDGFGPGEAAAIRLALRRSPPSIVLLDDVQGLRTAAELGLRLTGTAGIIVLAKQTGHISEARSSLLALQNAGLYLASEVLSALLTAAGESHSTQRAVCAE